MRGLALYGLPLHQRYEEATGAEMRTRYQMIVLAQLGHTAPSIARLVLRSEDTVARVLNRFLAARLNAVPRHISLSRKRTVTLAWEAELLRVIELDHFFIKNRAWRPACVHAAGGNARSFLWS